MRRLSNSVYLGDVVKRVKNKVDKNNTDLKYYVGGEHFDIGEPVINKRGVIEESTIGPAFRMSFEPGHVLLMSRNPHLKKAGMVNFPGICSDVSYVCETKDEEKLRQRFIPFIFQSEKFWRFAEANKKGSTNFFLNWTDFEKFEFNLPSIDEQDKLTELLWAATETKESYKRLLYFTDELIKSQFTEMFKNKKYPMVKASEVCEFITKGTTPPTDEIKKKPNEDSIPYLKVYNLSFDGRILFNEEPQYISRKIHDGKLARSRVYPKDVLMNIVGPPLGKFALVDDGFPEWNINQAIAIFRAKEMILPEYLLHSLMQPDVLQPFLDKAVGIRQLNLSLEQCRNFKFPLPPIELQNRFVEFVWQTEKSKIELEQAYTELDLTCRKIISENI